MNLPLSVTRALGSTELALKRNAPTILTVTGIAGFIATTALSIRATNRAVDVLPVISTQVAMTKELETDEVFTEKKKTQELIGVYARSSVVLLKIYGPTFLVGTSSILCVLAAHNMMLKRQASLVAAYTALDAGFKAYRQRVADKFGAEEERELYRRPNTIEGCDDEGKPCEIIDFDDDSVMPSPYAKFFNESSPNWEKQPEYNLMFLRSQQNYANNRLVSYGHVFLNEVYDMLGLPRTQIGQIVGWKYYVDGDGPGDNMIDFGLYNLADECNQAFINGYEHTILLDFNVDGVIKI